MKPLLAVVAGFALTLAFFASGIGFATWLLVAKPVQHFTPGVGVVDLWSRDPRPVDQAAQSYERVPAVQRPAPSDPATTPTNSSVAAADEITTGAIQPEKQAELPSAHVITGAVGSVVAKNLWGEKGACQSLQVSAKDIAAAEAAIPGSTTKARNLRVFRVPETIVTAVPTAKPAKIVAHVTF